LINCEDIEPLLFSNILIKAKKKLRFWTTYLYILCVFNTNNIFIKNCTMHRWFPISWSPVYCKIQCFSISKTELFCGIYDPSLNISKFILCICLNHFLELTCMLQYFLFYLLFLMIHCRLTMFQKLSLFLIFFTLQQYLGVLGEISPFWLYEL
jgi:hypothetical protein